VVRALKIFLRLIHIRFKVVSAPYTVETEDPYRGGKAYNWLISSAYVKTGWSFTSTLPYTSSLREVNNME